MNEIRRIGIRFLSMLFLLLLLGTCFDMTANAGVVEQKTSLINSDGELNVTDWFDPEDSLYIENGKLIIPNESTSDTRLVSKILGKKDSAYTNMVVVSGEMCFTKLPEGERFVLAIGLDGLEVYSEEPGNIEIEFKNKDGIIASVVEYNDSGEKQVIVAEKSIGKKVGANIPFKVTVTTDHKVEVVMNGKSVCKATVSEDIEGRIGFLQSGNCGVEISNYEAKFTSYDRPENTNISEDFEKEIYNQNLFAFNYISSSRIPAYTQVEEYEGNNVMMFYNSRLGYFGTKHQYSNFEMTFDVPYYLREGIKDESGKTIAASTQEFLVAFGEDALDVSGFGYDTAVEAIRFTPTSVHGLNHTPEKFRVEYGNMGYFDTKSNEGFSVKITVVDGHLTLGLKSLNATKYDTVAEADYEDFRTGYIKFWSVNDGNFAIDNIKITNLDEQPNLVDVEFKGALITQEDYEYKEAELTFRPTADSQEGKGESMQGLLIVGITSVGCAIILGISILARRRKGGRIK